MIFCLTRHFHCTGYMKGGIESLPGNLRDADKSSDKLGYIVVVDDMLMGRQFRAEIFRFLELIPITQPELDALESGEIDVETLYEKIGIGIRGYDRPSVI